MGKAQLDKLETNLDQTEKLLDMLDRSINAYGLLQDPENHNGIGALVGTIHGNVRQMLACFEKAAE